MAKVGDKTGPAGAEDHTHKLKENGRTDFWGEGQDKHRHNWKSNRDRTSVDHGHSHGTKEKA